MKMDVKEIITTLVEEIENNKELMKDFDKEPVKVIEKMLNVDLPDELVEKVIDGVKTKIALDKADNLIDSVSGVANVLKKLF